jgi:flagellar FliL protein
MAEKPAADAAAKPKSKKLLIIIIAAVLVLLLAAGGAVLFLMMSGSGDDALDEASAPQATQPAARPRTPPEFMPLDPIVINLADPGVVRFAQVGITLQVADPATSSQVTAFLPTIRDGILRQVSRRTAQELLNPEGKDQLAADILELVRQETGLISTPQAQSPIQAVLFASLIVQ